MSASPSEAVGDAVYVVQRHETLPDVDSGGERWVDVATVTAPPRSKRKTVIGKALAQSGIRPQGEPLRLRVLDAASARETIVEPVQPDPEWKIG